MAWENILHPYPRIQYRAWNRAGMEQSEPLVPGLVLPFLLDCFLRSKKGREEKMNPKPSQNFLRKNNFLIYIFSTTLFVKYIILKSQVKALLFIYFKKTDHFSPLPWSTCNFFIWYRMPALLCQDKSPVGRNLVAVGSCSHLTQSCSALSPRRVPHCLPTRNGTGLLQPCRRWPLRTGLEEMEHTHSLVSHPS